MKVLVMSDKLDVAQNLQAYLGRLIDASSMHIDAVFTLGEVDLRLRPELTPHDYNLILLDVRMLSEEQEPKVAELLQGIPADEHLAVFVWVLPGQGKRLGAQDHLMSTVICPEATAEFHRLVRVFTLGHRSHRPA